MQKKYKGVYIIQFDNGIKIGVSNDIEARIQNYASPWCLPIRKVSVVTCPYPRKVEYVLRRYFKRNMAPNSTEFIQGRSFDEILKKAILYRESREFGTFLHNFKFEVFEYQVINERA